MDRELLLEIARRIARLRADGVPEADIDSQLRDAGFGGYQQIVAEMRALPKERSYNPEGSRGVVARDIARSFYQGVGLGFGDEAEAALRAATSDESYKEVRDQIREQNRIYREQFPKSSFAGELAGSLLLPGTAGAAGGGAPVNLSGRILRGAAAGGAVGGVAGAGYSEGENFGEVLSDALFGATAGASFGGVLGATPVRLAERQAGRLAARRDIEGAIERSGLSPGDVRRTVTLGRQTRPDQFVAADVTPELADVARREAARGPESRFVAQRGRQEGQRIVADLRETSGFGSQSSRQAERGARLVKDQVRRGVYRPLDDEFRVFPDAPPEIEALLEVPEVSDHWARTLRQTGVGAVEGELPEIGFKQYQSLARRLKSDVDALYKNGKGAEAEYLKTQLDQIEAYVDDVTGGRYTRANLEFREANAVVDAHEAGRDGLRRSPEEIQLELADFNRRAGSRAPEALEAYRHGLVDRLASQLEDNPRRAGLRITEMNQNRLRQLFRTDEELQTFLQRAETEARMNVVSKELARKVPRDVRATGLQTLSRWGIVGKLARIVQAPAAAARQAQRQEITNVLLNPTQEAIDSFLNKRPKLGPTDLFGGLGTVRGFATGVGAANIVPPVLGIGNQ